MRNVILVDFKTTKNKYQFTKKMSAFSSEDWDVKCYPNNYFPRKFRQFSYFFYSFLFLFQRNRYSRIIAEQQFLGIILAFYCRLFHLKTKGELTILAFIYKPKNGLAGKLYYRFVKYALESDYIKHVIVHSKHEVTYYKKFFNKEFEFCAIGLTDQYKKFSISHEDPNVESNGYFLSCGRSNRDYDFLAKTFSDYPYNLKIISDECTLKSTKNTEVLNSVFDNDYMKLLAKCYAVIIPLKDPHISSGQLVALQSMMLGKPIIVSNSEGIADYLNDSIATLSSNNETELRNELTKLLDKDFYEKCCIKNRRYYLENFTNKKMIHSIYRIVYCEH